MAQILVIFIISPVHQMVKTKIRSATTTEHSDRRRFLFSILEEMLVFLNQRQIFRQKWRIHIIIAAEQSKK